MAVSIPVGPAAAIATATGVNVRLGSALSKAGEGTIYEIENRPDAVAKIFHPDLNGLAEKLDKVAAMVGSSAPRRHTRRLHGVDVAH
ncbi:hypothetical protein H7J08_08615 [Mycobacterium frederiksbergense]|uniref:hypothetical protein n=1 Tax=Mycolicibacterium frederiksbergense TaxID=117567 RepID=UPI0021F390CA|nr:hypothetical protein [Mycolicibacterium frederiksbergense]MCV7044737.1 hypothetical protein [Mycolicibacterium frederiksbergense]